MRKTVIIAASIASVFIGGCILAGAALLQYKPAQQHVEFQITKPSWIAKQVPGMGCNGPLDGPSLRSRGDDG